MNAANVKRYDARSCTPLPDVGQLVFEHGNERYEADGTIHQVSHLRSGVRGRPLPGPMRCHYTTTTRPDGSVRILIVYLAISKHGKRYEYSDDLVNAQGRILRWARRTLARYQPPSTGSTGS